LSGEKNKIETQILWSFASREKEERNLRITETEDSGEEEKRRRRRRREETPEEGTRKMDR
jgi:hypothetical protein